MQSTNHHQCMKYVVGALIPLIEFNLKDTSKTYRIVTDIGAMKTILTEMPLNFSEICGAHVRRCFMIIEPFSIDSDDLVSLTQMTALIITI